MKGQSYYSINPKEMLLLYRKNGKDIFFRCGPTYTFTIYYLALNLLPRYKDVGLYISEEGLEQGNKLFKEFNRSKRLINLLSRNRIRLTHIVSNNNISDNLVYHLISSNIADGSGPIKQVLTVFGIDIMYNCKWNIHISVDRTYNTYLYCIKSFFNLNVGNIPSRYLLK